MCLVNAPDGELTRVVLFLVRLLLQLLALALARVAALARDGLGLQESRHLRGKHHHDITTE